MRNGDKAYRVIISNTAAEMLISHVRFLSQVDEAAAGRFLAQFEAAANSLASMPRRCPLLVHSLLPKKKYRKLLLEKQYLIIFQIKRDAVYIDAVVDTRQDYRWLLL